LGDDRATPLVLAVLYLLPAVQFSIGAAIVQTLIPLLADGPLGIPVGIVGIALGLGAVGRFAGAMFAGQVSDRFGRRPALLPGLAVQIVGLATLMISQSTWAWWVTILLVSLGSVTVNVGTTILADLSGGSLGHRLGVFRLTGDSAFVVAPLLAGWLYARSGQAIATIPSVALTGFVLVAAFLWLPETHR
jgi:MFS family permease